MAEFITLLLFIGVAVLILRFIGAWMLRINDVISELKEINNKLDRHEH